MKDRNSLLDRHGFGVYVHVPFCAARCDYCAFATWTDKSDSMPRYVDAVRKEIAIARATGQLRPVSTIFFGGGTPSLLGGERIVSILDEIEQLPGAEITIECNPESTTEDLLSRLRDAGVSRISIGVQSFVDHVLDSLGRIHRADVARRAIELVASAGFASFSVDLIYGSRGETESDWRRTLDEVVSGEFVPPHISAYALSVEPGTPLSKDPRRSPDDDTQADRYTVAEEVLGSAGYSWYELSNWALPGHECRHNLIYWSQGDYLGFGCAAHSHLSGHRFANVRSIDRYLARIEEGASPVAFSEVLDGREQELEALQLALRTRAGVPSSTLDEMMLLEGLVTSSSDRFILTTRGRLLANEVAVRLLQPS